MMVLYSGTTCPYSHRCRFVLFEKGMDFEIRDVDLYAKPEDIALMNPYNEVPILVERDLILYESHIINEYIRYYLHAQLLRQAIYRALWTDAALRREICQATKNRMQLP
jgi:RNA polymerase-associated protein